MDTKGRTHHASRLLGTILIAGCLVVGSAGLTACTNTVATPIPTAAAAGVTATALPTATTPEPAATATVAVAATATTGATPAAGIMATPVESRDREQIRQTVEGYFAALQAQDRDRLREYLHDPEHIGTATLDRLLAQQREHRYRLEEIVDTQIQAHHATVTVRLHEYDGGHTQKLSLEREHGTWGIDSPGHHHDESGHD